MWSTTGTTGTETGREGRRRASPVRKSTASTLPQRAPEGNVYTRNYKEKLTRVPRLSHERAKKNALLVALVVAGALLGSGWILSRFRASETDQYRAPVPTPSNKPIQPVQPIQPEQLPNELPTNQANSKDDQDWYELDAITRTGARLRLQHPAADASSSSQRKQHQRSRAKNKNGNQEYAATTPQSHSFFRCTGNENKLEAYPERICAFENICLDVASGTFKYYAKPILLLNSTKEDPLLRKPTVLFDSRWGERVDFVENGQGFVALHQTTDFWGGNAENTWGPTEMIYTKEGSPIVTDPEHTVVLDGLHAIFSHWAYDDNLGHVLWEETAGLFFAMTRMGVTTDRLQALHYPTPLPDRPLSVKFRDAFFSAISRLPPRTLADHVNDALRAHASSHAGAASHVCFREVLAGGNMRRFLQRFEWHNAGHEPLFRALRARILRRHGLAPRAVPARHRIVVTNKTESNFREDASVGARKRAIVNLREVVDMLRTRYPGAEVDVVEWHKMEIREQLELMMSCTLFVTVPGGVSMMLPFLPEGAHAIIMDYYEREEAPNHYGTNQGESVSMESPFWNYWPHVKKLYYQIHGVEDLESDSDSKDLEEVSWREGVSYQIDLVRLAALTDQAFDGME
ncbi:hypothetical protein BC830DRAFT_1091919 [Chytriomyces sp. MP71]|nr:hypothetical protein BC830DRAFT_1091919 [Chytriomyces sp. MP71]